MVVQLLPNTHASVFWDFSWFKIRVIVTINVVQSFGSYKSVQILIVGLLNRGRFQTFSLASKSGSHLHDGRLRVGPWLRQVQLLAWEALGVGGGGRPLVRPSKVEQLGCCSQSSHESSNNNLSSQPLLSLVGTDSSSSFFTLQ